MKKNIAVLLISAMALGLAACGQTNGGASGETESLEWQIHPLIISRPMQKIVIRRSLVGSKRQIWKQ